VTGYVVRAASSDDSAALYVLHRAAMGPYIEALYGPWDERVQTAFHAAWFDAARVSVIERRGSLIGVLDYTWPADALQLHRIAVDPQYQGQGIGTAVLSGLLTRADRRDLPTRLEVFDINPARRLYERLGFVRVGCTGHRVHMARDPRPLAPLRPAPGPVRRLDRPCFEGGTTLWQKDGNPSGGDGGAWPTRSPRRHE
jgi:ribosomal protein S18 acetylase RimI-like enzyme